jgi:hypothetical protein
MPVSCVVSGVRHIVLLLLALTATARADDDEDQYFASFPTKMASAGITGHGGRVNGRPEAGVGPTLELGYGRGRWEYLATGSFESSSLARTDAMSVNGTRWRGAAGMRWLARQFIPIEELAVELHLRGLAGVSRYHWDDGNETQPDLDLGLAVAVRMLRKPGIAVRLDIDLVFADGDTGVEGGMVVGW